MKLTDRFLDKSGETVDKENLQLVGATALFIACKFDVSAPLST